MRYLRAIGKAVFVAVLVACPVVLFLELQHTSSIPVVLIPIVMFLVICAVVLRSWFIGGILLGAFLTLVAPPMLDGPAAVVMFFLPVPLGGFLGYLADKAMRTKPPPST